MAKKKSPEPIVTQDGMIDPLDEAQTAREEADVLLKRSMVIPAELFAGPSNFAGTPPGRPRGSKNRDRPEAVCRPARCPSCKSSRRGPFRDGPVNQQTCTVEVGGEVFNRQIWRNTECKDCGQHYRVIEYRFEPPNQENQP